MTWARLSQGAVIQICRGISYTVASFVTKTTSLELEIECNRKQSECIYFSWVLCLRFIVPSNPENMSFYMIKYKLLSWRLTIGKIFQFIASSYTLLLFLLILSTCLLRSLKDIDKQCFKPTRVVRKLNNVVSFIAIHINHAVTWT